MFGSSYLNTYCHRAQNGVKQESASLSCRYLGEEGSGTPLKAAVSLCNPFNLVRSDELSLGAFCSAQQPLVPHTAWVLDVPYPGAMDYAQPMANDNMSRGFSCAYNLALGHSLRQLWKPHAALFRGPGMPACRYSR